MRRRLDVEIARRGLAPSRTQAAALVDDRLVLVGGAIAENPARLVGDDESLSLVSKSPYVGRGGLKMAHALRAFGVAVSGRSALDAGASTGGFTDCLLQHGVRRVAAFDVGRHQLHETLRADERVHSKEGINVRSLTSEMLPFPCSLLVADLSFISLRTVLPVLLPLLSRENVGHDPCAILLVKPQFEVGRREASIGRGIIRDPDQHRAACDRVSAAVVSEGWIVRGLEASPLKGHDGNTEFLLWSTPAAAGDQAVEREQND